MVQRGYGVDKLVPIKRQTSNAPTCAFVAILQGPIEPSRVVPELLQQHWGLFASQIKEAEQDSHLMASGSRRMELESFASFSSG